MIAVYCPHELFTLVCSPHALYIFDERVRSNQLPLLQRGLCLQPTHICLASILPLSYLMSTVSEAMHADRSMFPFSALNRADPTLQAHLQHRKAH